MQQQEQTLDIQKYLQIFLRHKMLIIIILVVSLVFSAVAALIMPDVYRSRCVLLIRGASKLDEVLSRKGSKINARILLGMIRERMLGWEAVNKAIEACGLDKDIPKDDPEFLEKLYFKTTKSMLISSIGNDLIEVSYEGENPFINYKMLDSLVSSFMEYSLKLSRTEADESLDFIVGDLVRLKNVLDESERKLREFEEKHMAELPSSGGGKMAQLASANNGVREIERQILIENERLIALTAKIEGENTAITGEVVREVNPNAAVLKDRIIDTEIVLSDLRVKYYDGHPSVGMAEKRLKVLKEKFAEEKEKIISKETSIINPVYTGLLEKKFEVELQLMALYTHKKDLESQIATLLEQVALIPALKQTQAKLQRDYSVNKELYIRRLQQRSTAELEKEMSLSAKESPFSIVEPPRISNTPLKSKKMMTFLMGVVLGGMAAFGLAFGLEMIDPRFKSVDEARDLLQLPIFGMIPTIITNGDLLKSKRRKRRRLISAGVVVVLLIALTTVCIKVEPVNEAMHAGLEKIQKKVKQLK
ncbi:MAG: GumC family protein [Candidatus Brocadiales bacterium]